ncbi:hypothetical protein [uncultured Corynebacterium sp.]|uniref:hypothetical protein n=1 Tax=uncultured Corynebacterium sp. TaxID=159447 RepID=UPI0025CFFCDB|nr:hypothetical protein [uncultured Corynebacterium sp.]
MTSTRIACMMGLIGITALVITGCSSHEQGSEKPSSSSTSSASGSESSAAPEESSSGSATSEQEAEDSDRYGHFGEGPHQGKDATPEPLTSDQRKDGEQIAEKVMGLWIGDHSKPGKWREQLKPYGSSPFVDQVKMTDPYDLDEGQVEGVKDSREENAKLTVTVGTSIGDYSVELRRDPETKKMQVNYVAAEWRKNK